MRNSRFISTQESLILEKDFFNYKPIYVFEKEAYWFRDVEQRRMFLSIRISELINSIKTNKKPYFKWLRLFKKK